MTHEGVFCDTSFFIRLLDISSPLHDNAKGYFRYLTENDFVLFISTIAIAEYCAGGDFHKLPLNNLQIIPFNLNHARRAGEFAKIVFLYRKSENFKVNNRNIIPNDTKMFAQADCEEQVKYYLTSDTDSLNIYNLLKETTTPKFQFIDLNTPYSQTFGTLGL